MFERLTERRIDAISSCEHSSQVACAFSERVINPQNFRVCFFFYSCHTFTHFGLIFHCNIKVLHLYGNSTVVARSGENSKISFKQYKIVISKNFFDNLF